VTIGGLKGKQFWYAFWSVFCLADAIHSAMNNDPNWTVPAALSFFAALLLRPEPEPEPEE
jgi:hypothetical protein